jgi:capsular polysaccharide transport system ATP-binding protein
MCNGDDIHRLGASSPVCEPLGDAMILLQDVYKRYMTNHGPGKWVLEGLTLTIPPKINVGLVGGNGAGKSTLLRLIGGTDEPTRGKIERHCRISWPMGFSGGLQGSLTGRQNAKFVCRIHGHEDDLQERIAYIADFAELGANFDAPVKTYSTGMKSRLKFAISMAFDFDVYISDEVTAAGDASFKNKAAAAFKKLTDRASLIMVSHGESTLRRFCSAGVWLNNGKAYWFDDIDDALKAYKDSLPKNEATGGTPQTEHVASNLKTPGIGRINSIRRSLGTLEAGLKGETVLLGEKECELVIAHAKRIGMTLLGLGQIKKRGYILKAGSKPILRKIDSDTKQVMLDFFDIGSQCEIGSITE